MNEFSINTKLKDYIYYFLRQTEEQFAFYLQILEGHDSNKQSLSLTGTVLSAAASAAIPKVGKGVGSAIEKGDKHITKKEDKDAAVALSAAIYRHRANRMEIRKILIEALYEIFCCYEAQFANLTCNGGPIRAVHKLGCDASLRYISYLKKTKCEEAITRQLIIDAIRHDESGLLQKLGFKKGGREVINNDDKWNSAKIYRKSGLYDANNNNYYKNISQRTKADVYGYRKLFTHETLLGWELEQPQSTYQYSTNFSNFQTDYSEILEYIMSQNPEEFATYDREIKKTQIIEAITQEGINASEDRDLKHQQSLQHAEGLTEELKKEHEKTRVEVGVVVQKLELPRPDEVTKNDFFALQSHIEKKLEEQPDAKLQLVNGAQIRKELKKIDPTRTGEFKKIKEKVRKFRF